MSRIPSLRLANEQSRARGEFWMFEGKEETLECVTVGLTLSRHLEMSVQYIIQGLKRIQLQYCK